jgi:hypothetical protein
VTYEPLWLGWQASAPAFCLLHPLGSKHMTKRQPEFKPKAYQYAICRQLKYEPNILLATEGDISFRLYVDCKPHGCKQMERTDENEMTLYYYDGPFHIEFRFLLLGTHVAFRKGNVLGGLTTDQHVCMNQTEVRNRSHWYSSAVQARATFLSTFMLLCSRTTEPNLLAKLLSLMTVLRSRKKAVRHIIDCKVT